MNPYNIVDAFEQRVADYAGAKYGVAVNSCSNALMLSAKYIYTFGRCGKDVWIPKYTYVGVPYAFINAGFTIHFHDQEWEGAYLIEIENIKYDMPSLIVDSARRFTRGMYEAGTLYCLSFHWYKHLPVGRGGMILTDDKGAYDTLRKMRYDGRTAGVAPINDTFDTPGYHCYMIPEDAARGLMLMNNIKDYNEDLIENNYTDLSQYKIFTNGY